MIPLARRIVLVAILGLVSFTNGMAQDPTRAYFYKPLNYGSMSMFTPWNVIINGSHDILQLDRQERRLGYIPYGPGLEGVWRNLLAPGPAISKYGWWKFISTELLPLNLTKEGGQWVPNYQLHLIGGGMTYRMLSEWYEYQGVAAPDIWAGGTIAVYHVLNEAVENGRHRGYNTDLLADLLVFDWLGVVLFSNDDVAGFFSETLHMTDWSNLPIVTFPAGELSSNGLYYALKWNIPGLERWSAFYLMGMSNMGGASYRFDDEHSITLAGGLRGKYLYDLDTNVNLKTLELVPTGGVYWDRNNSLMASLTASGQESQSVILNAYPGIFEIAGVSPAFWAAWGTTGGWGVGVAVRSGIGVGWR